MHPSNRFWDLLTLIFKDDFKSASIDQKIKLLKTYHIALFDVVKECELMGSSDASMEVLSVHDIPRFIQESNIQSIILNGRKAESIFLQYFPSLKHLASYKPSTSAANARYRLNDLYHAWKDLAHLVEV